MKIQSDLINNDVPAVGQLKDSDCVKFCPTDGADRKILFLGNSITRHGVKPELGWYGDYGMAASCASSDYVHRLIGMLERGGKKISYCVCNMSEWEATWDDGLLESKYGAARDFCADTVIVRLGENARLLDRAPLFMPHYEKMVEFFSRGARTVVCTDLFWEYEPFDTAVRESARSKGYAFAQLHDLGALDEMKAINEFAHAGVAAHPGDRGMNEIAARIYSAIAANAAEARR